MADYRDEKPSADPDIRKEESTIAHNIRQMLGCLPVLGSRAVGICGLIAFAVGIGNSGHANQPGWFWLIGGCIGLIASGIGFGVLGWIVWSNRLE
ncbi:MAG: hypothetical protein HYX68_25870 [Planctomycetes bacterium]|nr:hypothetical protein [Planctomycetota bacterium]